MAAADPVGDAANAVTDTASSVWGTTRNVITGTFKYVALPGAFLYGAGRIASAYSTGGMSELVATGVDAAHGLGTAASGLSDGVGWVADKLTAINVEPAVEAAAAQPS